MKSSNHFIKIIHHKKPRPFSLNIYKNTAISLLHSQTGNSKISYLFHRCCNMTETKNLQLLLAHIYLVQIRMISICSRVMIANKKLNQTRYFALKKIRSYCKIVHQIQGKTSAQSRQFGEKTSKPLKQFQQIFCFKHINDSLIRCMNRHYFTKISTAHSYLLDTKFIFIIFKVISYIRGNSTKNTNHLSVLTEATTFLIV